MTFQPEVANGRQLGHAMRVDDLLFFFGGVTAPREALATHFAGVDFAYVKQVHGRRVVPTSPTLVEADAHFTSRRGVAPVVVTADCIPILVASPNSVAAIHAGWRGVANGVIGQTASCFEDQATHVAIGPHLTRSSFEIGRDVADTLLAASPDPSVELCFTHPDPLKVYFDLTALARAQIRRAFGARARIFEFTPDTLTTPEYHSYRRSTGATGRNLSFVVRNF